MSTVSAAPGAIRRLAGKQVVVIGGGLGGLAVAARLAARGARVTVCERGATLGGKMNCWRQDGFRFDTGPSLITMPWVFEQTFAAAGADLRDHVTLVPIAPLAEYHYPDGTTFRYSSTMPEWLETVRRIEPADVDGFWRFMALGARIFELSQATFFARSPWSPPDAAAVRALRRLPVRHAWGNYHRTVAAHFRSPYLRQLFDRYPTYVGSSPYRSPATLAVIPYIEHAFGGWYVRGGLYRLVEALADIAHARGVEVRTGAPVTTIVSDGSRVSGVVLGSGAALRADAVIVNADASSAAGLLAPGAPVLDARDRSLSGFVLLLALRRTVPALAHHAVHFSGDYRREFADLFERRIFPDEPTVYVNVPSRIDRSVVPDGGTGDTVFIMANAPASGGTWTAADTARAEHLVLARLARSGIPDLAPDVVARDVWTPARLEERYGAPGGAIYGTHSHGWRHAFLRPRNRDARMRGLYFVGGSTHPGGGTPTVLMSARITGDLVEADA